MVEIKYGRGKFAPPQAYVDYMNMIADFMRNGYQNYSGEFLPTFFIKEGWVNGTSVYLQLLPYLIFGKSLIVTRLVSAFITLFGAIAIGVTGWLFPKNRIPK